MKPLAGLGAVLLLLGIIGMAMPFFTTQDTHQVAKLGDLSVQSRGCRFLEDGMI